MLAAPRWRPMPSPSPNLSAQHVLPYMLLLLRRSTSGLLRAVRPVTRPLIVRSRTAVMTPYKLPLVVLRLGQLLTTTYIEFAVVAMLFEQARNSVLMDGALLARVGLASLAILWTLAAFCWSTCLNGTRVMAVPGLIGDAIAAAAYVVVAALSRGPGATDCNTLGPKTVLWSDALGKWIDEEGAAMSSSARLGQLDEGFVQRQCSFGKSAFAFSVATWYDVPRGVLMLDADLVSSVLFGVSVVLQALLARESRRPSRISKAKADVERPGDKEWPWANGNRGNGYEEVR